MQVMLAQQECIAQRVRLLEEAQAQASSWAVRAADSDPDSRRAQARHDAVARETARRSEREALIDELRDSLLEVAGGLRCSRPGPQHVVTHRRQSAHAMVCMILQLAISDVVQAALHGQMLTCRHSLGRPSACKI